MSEPRCLIENQNGKFLVNTETVRWISMITKPLVVVSIVGPLRTGKSYLLNQLMGTDKGFAVRHSVQAETKGIWIWSRPHPLNENLTLVLLDTEGLGDTEKRSKNNDARLFAMAVLLSSTLVYNSKGVIDNDALENLRFVAELTDVIKVRSTSTKENGSEFCQFFPNLVWAVRDITQELKIEGKQVTADGYLEYALHSQNGNGKAISLYNATRGNIRRYFKTLKCFVFPQPVEKGPMLRCLEKLTDSQLDPEFLQILTEFREYILKNSPRKTYQGRPINGSYFCDLVDLYVKTFNSERVPCLEDIYATTERIENQKALTEALKVYKNIRSRVPPLPTTSLGVLSNLHGKFWRRALNTYLIMCFGEEKSTLELKAEAEKVYNEILVENETASTKVCQDILQKEGKQLEDKLKRGAYVQRGGYKLYCADRQAVVDAYNKTPGKGIQADDVLQRFLIMKETEAKTVLKLDENLDKTQKKWAAEIANKELAERKAHLIMAEQKKADTRQQQDATLYQELLTQLEIKRKDQRLQLKREFNLSMEQQLEKQKSFLQKGFEQELAETRAKIDGSQRKYETEHSKLRVAVKVLKVLIPLAIQILLKLI